MEYRYLTTLAWFFGKVGGGNYVIEPPMLYAYRYAERAWYDSNAKNSMTPKIKNLISLETIAFATEKTFYSDSSANNLSCI